MSGRSRPQTASGDPPLPYGRHLIEDDDVAAVAAVLRGSHLTSGPAVEQFEDALARIVGARHAVGCSSGTAALHLALLALEIGPGDAVVVPSVTFVADMNVVRHAGAEVLFADVDPETALMGAENLTDALDRAHGARVKAAVPVHMNGQCSDLRAIAGVAEACGVGVIEDGCHALGARYRTGAGDVAIGGCRDSRMTVFSFHPVKVVAMGEGGAVTTNDATLRERLLRLRNHGLVRETEWLETDALAYDSDGSANPWYYEVPEPGFNYRLSDIHSALGVSQLAKLDRFVERRRRLVDRYDRLLAPLAPLVRPIARNPDCRPAWHLYAVLIDFDAGGVSRAELMRRLGRVGIQTQVHFVPVHMQPYYRRRYGALSLPGAETYYRRCLSLPLFPAMADADVDRVVEALARSLGAPA